MLITSSEEGKKFIEGQDWKIIIFKLTKYALYRLKLYKWYGKEGGNVGAGKTAEDYAMQAIEKFLDGTRHWSPEKCDLLGFLKGCIKSDMGHQANGWENKNFTDLDGGDGALANEKFLKTIKIGDTTPRESLASQEARVAVQQITDEFIDLITKDKDQDMVKVLECIMDGVNKSQDMARKMGKTIVDINNLKKKFQRRSDEFQKLYLSRQVETIKGGA